MSELAERAEKLWLAVRDISDYGGTLAGIEQALLVERRLAMEEAAKLACAFVHQNLCAIPKKEVGQQCNAVAQSILAAVATPRGGE